MIEIIGAVYVTCLTLSWLLVVLNVLHMRRQFRDASSQRLNVNLKRIGLFWSRVSGDFAPWAEGAIDADFEKSCKTSLWLGLIGFLSVPGLLLVAAVILLGRDRREQRVLRSDLALRTDFTVEEIETHVRGLR